MSATSVIILTPVRLFGEALERCLRAAADMTVCRVLQTFDDLHDTLSVEQCDVVLVDVTQGVDAANVRLAAERFPMVALVALGLGDQTNEVIKAGQSGFSGFVARDASLDNLLAALRGAAHGRLVCSEETSAQLLRALFRKSSEAQSRATDARDDETTCLTRRESDVATLLRQGYSNKAIARTLCVSVATVKHHVHNVLCKLQVSRRGQLSRYAGPHRNFRETADPDNVSTLTRRNATS
jgi:DNA-binding NarL/FixJ family response regulator